MELYLIRHGQSTNNALPEDQPRVQDAPLSELGVRQVEKLAAYFADGRNRDPWFSPSSGYSRYEPEATFGFTHLYTSAMQRALATAYPIARALDLKPEIWIDIHEHGGVYQETPDGTLVFPGQTRSQILTAYPDMVLPDAVTEEGWWPVAAGAEAPHAAYGRAIKVAAELRRRASEARQQNGSQPPRVAIVSHGTFIDTLLKALFNQLPSRQMFYLHYNTAVTRLDFVDADRLLVRFLNRTAHLPPDMVS
jgi:broad specificity phosphatase PhoE